MVRGLADRWNRMGLLWEARRLAGFAVSAGQGYLWRGSQRLFRARAFPDARLGRFPTSAGFYSKFGEVSGFREVRALGSLRLNPAGSVLSRLLALLDA